MTLSSEPEQPWLTYGELLHGWQPVSLRTEAAEFEFNASYVLNDPLYELTTAALWLLKQISPPLCGNNFRCIHFWREPEWHTLHVSRLDSERARTTFYEHHEGGGHITLEDLGTARNQLESTMPVATFCQRASQITQETNVPLHNARGGLFPLDYAVTLFNFVSAQSR